MTTTIDFDLGTLAAVADSNLLTPLLQQHSANASSGSDVDCSFNWNCQDPSHNDWKEFMSYTSNDDDLTDISSTDITYFTFKTEWYGGDYMSDSTTLIAGADSVQVSGSYVPTTIGDELTMHIGKNIFGAVGGLDMLSNEVDFTANVKSESKTQLDIEIDTLLVASSGGDAGGTIAIPGTNGGNQTRDNANFAYKILSHIMHVEDRKQAAIAAFISGGGTTKDTHVKMPFIAGDTITFTIKVQPKFDGVTTGIYADNAHGIGTNQVPSRKYKITLHLTDTTPA